MSKRVTLECGDVIYFPAAVSIPRRGEKIWCRHCKEYMTVGEPSHKGMIGIYPDYMWECESLNRSYIGRCLECGYEKTERSHWDRLKEHMETHHLREHTNSSLVSRMKTVPIPPKYSEPPF